jgi:hypothetical protein
MSLKLFYILGFIVILVLFLNKDRCNSFNRRGRREVVPLLDSPQWVAYIDKIKFKHFCKRHGVNVFETISIFNNVEDIKSMFDDLPNSFIVKYTTESGMNLIVRNKNEWTPESLHRKVKQFKRRTVFNWLFGEPQYKYVIPRYMIEELVQPIPQDYKIIVTDGKPILLFVFVKHSRAVFRIRDDFSTVPLLDCKWKYAPDPTIELPPQTAIDEMCNIAIRFASEINLAMFRVDLYYVNSRIYGGEITLTSGAFATKISELCAEYASGTRNEISSRVSILL